MHTLDLRDTVATTIALARGAAPVAALASGLLGPAWGAPGDLDPSFADVGRAYPLPDLNGPAWSIQAQGDDDFIFAGGDYYDSYYYNTVFVSGFTQRLSSNGSIDQTFAALTLAKTEVFDVAVQGDGKAIGVGRTLQGTPESFVLTVFRLDPDGALDPTFGVGGLVRVASEGLSGVASSVILESDGRIVVAGVRDERLIVLRLLANGVFDETFADSGVFTGPDTVNYVLPRILRVADGGYRVSSQGVACQVLALIASGAVDESFGASGLAGLDLPSTCNSMAVQADGRLLVAGQRGSQGLAIRLLASGEPDETFQASAVAEAMEQATALDVSAGGSILVAGRDAAGVPATALVMRLQSNGALDTTFGNEGSTLIDLPSERGTSPTINDITVKGGKVLVAGGDGEYWYERPFVARLLADDGTDGPGVLGVLPPFQVDAKEKDGEAVVTVRRTGGRAGRVSVLLQTRSATSFPAYEIATEGEDYATTAGTLTWEDGDVGDQQIAVPILPDAPGAVAEEHEFFEVSLSDVQGDAGLGTRIARVAIAPDGEPGGQFSIVTYQAQAIQESQGSVEVLVSRNYYDSGTVSVTVSPTAGTAAAGDDFAGDPVTLTWADGERDDKSVKFTIVNDQVAEDSEHFSVQLSAPTGGAIVGPRSAVAFTILRSDQPASSTPPSTPRSRSGGGGVGLLSMLLLGLAGLLRQASPVATRSRRTSARDTQPPDLTADFAPHRERQTQQSHATIQSVLNAAPR